IARWTNLSVTVFVLPPTTPQANYRIRIFTPMSELRFAGYPSIGTAHALLEAGLVTAADGHIVQECAAGLLPISVQADAGAQALSIRSPQARQLDTPTGSEALLAAALGRVARGALPPQLWDNGPRW